MAKGQKNIPVTDEIATAAKDIDIYAGWITRMENPDPVLRTESAGKGLKLYDEVARDAHAKSVLQTRALAVIGKEWEVLPGGDPEDKKAQALADFVKAALLSCNFDQARQELLKAVLYGYQPGEIIWRVRDGAVVPVKIRVKHPRRFSFTMDRELRLLTPSNMIDGEPVPDRKFVCFSYGSSDNPYGEGLGQVLWWPVWFKKHGIKFWLVFLEKFGTPTTHGKYPTGTAPEEQQKLLDAIDAMQTETGITTPDTMQIELIEATRSGKVEYSGLCEYMDKLISKAVLGQTATTEGTPGKLGNDQAQQEVRADILKADADLSCECLNETLIPWIVDYNFPGVTEYPKMWIRCEEGEDLKDRIDVDKTLAKDLRLPMGRKYFYETYAVPEPEDGEELVDPQITQINADKNGVNGGQFSEPKINQDVADIYTERLETEAAPFMDAMIEPVRRLIENATSLEEIRDGLIDLYPDMDAGNLGVLMQHAFAAADMLGRYQVGAGSEPARSEPARTIRMQDA